MRALIFDPRTARLPAAGLASRLRPRLILRGPSVFSLASLREMPQPTRPAASWARLRVLSCGVCGSDLKELLLQASWDSPLTGLVSLPHVPGHEIVAKVIDAPAGSGLEPGQAVVVDPWLGCVARGVSNPCDSCQAGYLPHCRALADGGPWGAGRGMHLGAVDGLPGGFSEIIHAHPSQCHLLPPGIPPGLFVLADPLAVGLHAVEKVPDPGPGPVLVIGAGTIGLGLALAARERWPQVQVLVTCAWAHQVELVHLMGATSLPAPAPLVIDELARRAGGRLVRPWRGLPFTIGGGAAVVLDSIGTAATQQLALRVLAPGGRIVVVGVGQPARSDSTLAYFKEAEIIGSNGYGLSRRLPGAPHLLDVAIDLISRHRQTVAAWHTHDFPLSRWRAGFWAAANPQRTGAIKVSLSPEEARSR